MFKWFKKKNAMPRTEAEFDVLGDMPFTLNGREYVLPRADFLGFFIGWSKNGFLGDADSLAYDLESIPMIMKITKSDGMFEDDLKRMEIAKQIIDQLLEIGVIEKNSGSIGLRISKRGEAIRQYYILKLGMRGNYLCHMDKFESA